MAYDESLARRVHAILADQPELDEKKMFGGLAFMLRGNMCCGIMRDELMVRAGPEQYAALLALPHAHALELGGRPMRGMVGVAPAGLASDEDLDGWVRRGIAFAETLPAK
jgi:hypothetical protein